MSQEPKIVLLAPVSDETKLASFVEDCLRNNVSLIAIAGSGCQRLEDIIDELIVGDGSDSSRFITTSSHPDEALDEVIEFANMWRVTADGETRVVRL